MPGLKKKFPAVFSKTMRIFWVVGLAAVVTGCGGPGLVSPTPIPADVVRPVQNTPAFPEQVAIAAALTLTPTPVLGSPGQVVAVTPTPTPSPTVALDRASRASPPPQSPPWGSWGDGGHFGP